MKPDPGLASWIRLSLVDGLGPATFRKLLSAFGLPGHILGTSHASLCRAVHADMAGRILDQQAVPIHLGDTPEDLHDRIQEQEHHLLPKVLAEWRERGLPVA